MLKKNKDGFELACDECSETEQIEGHDFIDALNFVKGNGWRAHKIGQSWEHSCPACLQKMEDGHYAYLDKRGS